MIHHTTEVRVRYADTDQMKFAYYGKFFEYFEQGRSDLLRSIGLPYTEVESMGYYIPVIEAHAEYRHPARYDDLLLVLTMLRDIPVAKFRIDYEVRTQGGREPIATGYTMHTFINARTGRPSRAPAQFLEAVEKHFQQAERT